MFNAAHPSESVSGAGAALEAVKAAEADKVVEETRLNETKAIEAKGGSQKRALGERVEPAPKKPSGDESAVGEV